MQTGTIPNGAAILQTRGVDGGRNSNKKPHEAKTNRADEIGASVLARFQVLKDFSGNLKCSNAEGHPKILNSMNIGGCVGTKEALYTCQQSWLFWGLVSRTNNHALSMNLAVNLKSYGVNTN